MRSFGRDFESNRTVSPIRQLRHQMSRAPEIRRPERGNRLRSMCVFAQASRIASGVRRAG